MFETSVVQARALQPRGRFSLLTISLIAHSAVIVGAIAVSVATIDFPSVAPKEFATAPVFLPVQIPPPLGDPNGGRRATPAQESAREKPPAPQPNQLTAPVDVPETITPIEGPPAGAASEATGEGEGTVDGPVGVPWGTDGGVGDLDAPPAITPAVEEKVYQAGGEVKAPVKIHHVDPLYPPVLLRTKLPGKAVVRCIIDKNGRVRDAQLVYASLPPFGESVMKAVQQWRFTPASLRGQAVECYLDLNVDFGVR